MTDEIIFYIKKGRRYVPHSSYSSEFCDAFPKGTHLVQCYPGGTSRRFNVDPAYAPMIAAGRLAEEVISKKIVAASEIRMQSRTDKDGNRTPLTPSQHAAWDNLIKEFGDDARQLAWPSAMEAAGEAVKAMVIEAEKLLSNPSVKKSYDNFMLVCQLTKDHTTKAV